MTRPRRSRPDLRSFSHPILMDAHRALAQVDELLVNLEEVFEERLAALASLIDPLEPRGLLGEWSARPSRTRPGSSGRSASSGPPRAGDRVRRARSIRG